MRQFDNLLSGGVGKRSAGDEHAPELVDPGVACRVDIFEHLIKIQQFTLRMHKACMHELYLYYQLRIGNLLCSARPSPEGV